jgi:spore coat protein CotH
MIVPTVRRVCESIPVVVRVGAVGACLIVMGPFARCTASQGNSLNADRLLDRDHLVEIAIDMPADDWAALCKQTRDFASAFGNPADKPFTYFKGNISIDGVPIEEVGIRKKGFIGSLDDVRPSLKIKFDEFVDQSPIKGLESLTLNNGKQDGSLVSQYLTYRLFDAAGVHAPRCNFARVTVNGTYLGVYSNVESIGKPFLKRRFGDSSGNLFEGTIADFYPKALNRLEAKGRENDHTRAKAMRLAELLAARGELSIDQVAALVDIDNFLRFWAAESLIGFWDGYTSNQNNYWVYENPKNGRFYFMPWGADGSFMGVRPPFGFSNSQKATCVYAESMLANRLYHTDGVAERYRAVMLEILDTAWSEDGLVAEVDRVEKLIGGHLHQRQSWMSRGMNSVRTFIRNRRATILKEFEDWPVAVPTTPRKPMYMVDVGKVSGTFSTDWQDQAPADPAAVGMAEIQLELDGESVAFSKLGVQGGPYKAPFGGGPFGRAEPQAGVVFTGIRQSDSEKVTLTLWTNRRAFAASAGKSIPLQGMLLVGKAGFNFFNPSANRSLAGEAKLTKVGTAAGDAIVGVIDLKIVETHGGFMVGRGELGVPKSAREKANP